MHKLEVHLIDRSSIACACGHCRINPILARVEMRNHLRGRTTDHWQQKIRHGRDMLQVASIDSKWPDSSEFGTAFSLLPFVWLMISRRVAMVAMSYMLSFRVNTLASCEELKRASGAMWPSAPCPACATPHILIRRFTWHSLIWFDVS